MIASHTGPLPHFDAHNPSEGAATMPVDLDFVRTLARDANNLAVLATTRLDGSVHASLISAGVMNDPIDGGGSIGMVIGGSTAKLRLLRRTRRAATTFQAGFRWVTVEGPVRIAGPDDLDGSLTATEIPPLLRKVFVAAGGTHENWAEYDRVMAEERRAAVFIRAARIIGNG
jgi:PPOX class probable F420-dependent enzyme